MRADALAELRAIMRGERAQSSGTHGTPGTLTIVPPQKCPSFHAFHVFRPEQVILRNEHFEPGTRAGTWPLPDDITEAERAAIALELGRVPPTYADAWAAFQTRKPGHVTETDWQFAVDCAGRFLDEWGALASAFGWQASDVFGSRGLAWFCAAERVRALGPDKAVTSSGRIFARRAPGDG
jgi:hypothetical protein